MELDEKLIDAHWTKDANGEFVFSIASVTSEPTEFVAAVNPTSGALEVNYKLQGQDGLLEPVLTCKPVVLSAFAEQLGGIYFDLVFTSATEAFVDVTCVAEAFPGMNATFDKAGTYTIENNVISLTVGGETFPSTFVEETGTYKLNYVLVGQQATLYPELTTSLWAE